MSASKSKGTLAARIWLTAVVFCQIFLTPMAAFSITYLFRFTSKNDNFTISFEQEMIPWILTASISYGMIALMLALITGGFTPIWVTEKGGWRAAFGFSRVARDAKALRQAKAAYKQSPHGRLTLIVHKRMQDGYSLISTHGGLILLAIPFQLILVILPLSVVMFTPDGLMRPNRRLESALVVYLILLIVFLRIFPSFCQRFISLAAFTRRWLISMTRLSWMAPVLVLWLLGRMASLVALSWMGDDIIGSIQIEQNVFEAWLGIQSIPESSFLDLLTALAVMPLAAFTTLSVLGGGSGNPPGWMIDQQENSETATETKENGAIALDDNTEMDLSFIDESNSVPPEIPEIEEDSEDYSSSEDVGFGSMFD
ncbi:MAG: hypothetical protein VYB50_07225 [Candidatus Thermoplasmatota archaeon]|nr:hypothetical protein [Candidatus Thermoplasmatota archaeon]